MIRQLKRAFLLLAAFFTAGAVGADVTSPYATGGEISTFTENNTTYYVHKFTTVGSSTFVNTGSQALDVDYLVVGGGGAGGSSKVGYFGGGGGGGGAVVSGNNYTVNGSGSLTIIVGAGGVAPNSAEARVVAGSSSIEGVITAAGGGAGACAGGNVATGLATGGGGAGSTLSEGQGNFGKGASGTLHSGASSVQVSIKHDGSSYTTYALAGGGGGAGGDGKSISTDAPYTSGNGGDGVTSSITGSPVTYGGGGGGGGGMRQYFSITAYGAPGVKIGTGADGAGHGGYGYYDGGGGNGTFHSSDAGNGTDGLGGGGGGAGANVQKAGNGGSGVVIIRYAAPEPSAQTYTVTFTTNNVTYSQKTDVESGYTLTASDLPTGLPAGSWDVDPVGVAITANVSFNYTVQSSDPTPSGDQLASGGDNWYKKKIDGVDYWIHEFTSTGAALFTNISGAPLDVEYLVVGGGGAGGDGHYASSSTYQFGGGGGGGGGQVIEMSGTLAVGDSWNVYVGAGGSVMNGDEHKKVNEARTSAQASAISNGTEQVTLALGGGSGASTTGSIFATPGEGIGGFATGGGGSGRHQENEVYYKGGKGTCFDGGDGYWVKTTGVEAGGGGGGGAGGKGGDGDAEHGGNGGDGVSSSITGSDVNYGGGGGGGAGINAAPGSGVNGGKGGKREGNSSAISAEDGSPNTGNGGGGGAIAGGTSDKGNAGNGGSGVVIIRYKAGASAPVFNVTFTSNTTYHVEAYDKTVTSNGVVTADLIPAWIGGSWDVEPEGAIIVCNTNFNYTVTAEPVVIHKMPFDVIGDDAESVISFTGTVTTNSVTGGKVYVDAGVEQTLGAVDMTGKTYCGCWRDDSTGELFWGETVVVTPTKPTTYTACFGPMWHLYKDKLYDSVAANHYYHLDNGIWNFKVTFNESTREITVNKLLDCTTDPVGGIVNWTTPIMDADGVTNGNKIVSFSNYDNINLGYAEVFEKSDDTSRLSRNHYKLPTMIFLPETTEEVDVMALRYLNNMTGVLCIPKNVKLYHQAFGYATKLEGLLFKGGVDGGQTFEGKTYIIMDKDTGKPVAHYSDGNQFENSPNIRGSIVLPSTVTSLPKNCFHSDKSIQEIDLTYVTNIDDRALFDCHSLTNAINLEAVTSVLFQGCDGCWNLSGDVTFTNLVVGNFNAFANCGFTSVKLPSATEFHYGVFANNVNLTNIVFSESQVVFAHNVEDDHPQWPYTESSQIGCYCTNNLPCWLTFPGSAPVFTNMANRATCSILFGEHDVASGRQPVIDPKELCLEANWDYDPDGWQKIYDEIGDPMPYNSARPIQNVPADLDVRGTINWMYKFKQTEFKKTYSDDPIENARQKSKYGYEDLENNKAKAFLICRPKGLYFFVK